jgi:hypothetical protein
MTTNQYSFKIGSAFLLSEDAPGGQYSAYFQEDEDTGYFYAVDLAHSGRSLKILDGVHIYDIDQVEERDRARNFAIVWSGDGQRCALLIDGEAHATFDFDARRGYCRNNFPNEDDPADGSWHTADHLWSDQATDWLVR